MPTPPSPRPPLIRFDVFEVDLKSAELHKRGRKIRLQDQPFRVLAMLLDRPREVVSREEMRQKLWPADTFVDFDHGLNSAVARLREALDDSAEKPRFVETVPRQGYRFIGKLEARVSTDSDSPTVHLNSKAIRNETSDNRLEARRWLAVLALIVVLVSAGGWLLTRSRFDPPLASLEVMPLAGMRGFEFDPAFAPDGSEVAFVLVDGQDSGIYTTLVGGERPLRLTSGMHDCCPAWSPDHRQVAFLRFSRDDAGVYLVPALGGTERGLYTVSRPALPGLAWSPDGKVLAFTEGDPHTGESWVTFFSLADSSRRRLTFPPHESRDETPAFSPDGSQVAFVRGAIAGVANDVFVVRATGGEAKRLTFDNVQTYGVTWAADGRDVVFASMRGRALGLWRVPASGGPAQPVAGAGSPVERPAISPRGDLLAYQQKIDKDAIARITLTTTQHADGSPTVIISEKGSKLRPRFSPDGSRIAFESDRLGSGEIWTCNSSGGNCAQITSLHGTAGTAAWSPDGRFLAFEFHPKEHAEIYVVELPNGVPQLVSTIPGADNLAPSWSRDGKWIYFSSKRNDLPFQVWKVPFKVGSPVQVTKNGGIGAIESADGRYLYYSKYEQPGLWRMSLDDGGESRILDDQPSGHSWFNWALASNGIYFLNHGELPPVEVRFFDFATKKTSQIATLDKPIGWGLGLAPDGKSLLYVEAEFAESNIMLVKNFR